MSAKPAARKGDPTADGDNNPIDSGSPDVLFDGLPAAREGDTTECGSELCDQLSSTVLINGKAAVMVDSEGTAGNVVMSGSGTVLIGDTISSVTSAGIEIGKRIGTSLVETGRAITNSIVDQSKNLQLDFDLSLQPGGNHTITPLDIPAFDELDSKTTQNREIIDFIIENKSSAADQITLQVFSGTTLLYTESNTTVFCATGKHKWQWDGYSNAGVLDTRALKSNPTTIRLTATKADKILSISLLLRFKPAKVQWVDVRVDRGPTASILHRKNAHVTVRPAFIDGGIDGTNSQLSPPDFSTLIQWAREGIELYWSRNASRGGVVANGISTRNAYYNVTITTDLDSSPTATSLKLITDLTKEGKRSTTFPMLERVYHNLGYAYDAFVTRRQMKTKNYYISYAKSKFILTSAHEFGHFILNAYRSINDSWSHKETSTIPFQIAHKNNPTPDSEIDLMHYHSDSNNLDHFRTRDWIAASEQDVKGLISLAKISAHESA